jgi:carbohydrate binding protein with CBM4/9 domain/tetratricopeptide repeat protein
MSSNRYLRLLLVMFLVGVCLWTIQAAGAFGVSRLLVRFSMATPNLAVAEKAIQLTPSDAQAHFAGAAAFSSLDRSAESVVEMERAVGLRPADYSLWLQLGLLRDQLGQTDAALAAFDEAVRLAPFYARPRWQRGNLLLRAGRYEQAFKDLSQAAKSNPELLPALLGLAWNISKGDPNLTAKWLRIETDHERNAFAKYLAHRGMADEVISLFGAVNLVPEEIRHELVEQLLAKGAYHAAFRVWKAEPDLDIYVSGRPYTPQVYDGGFESPLTFNANGFGWRLSRKANGVALSVNSGQPHTGSKNLQIDFTGDSNPNAELISQVILVEPSRQYQVNFASRSQDLVTGGLPLVVVKDAQGERKLLGKSGPLSGESNWKVLSFGFSTGPTTNAVLLSVQRENCSTSPCPIFGSLSLDSFSIVQVR